MALQTATGRSEPTASLLFDFLPATAFIGVDLLSATTSPNLRGIKNIPAGYHFLYSSSDASHSIRHGWFFSTPTRAAAVADRPGQRPGSSSETLNWRWSREDECLIPETDPCTAEQAQADLARAWEWGLVDYTQPARDGGEENGRDTTAGGLGREWRELTWHFTDALLDRVLATGRGGEDDGRAGGRVWSISSVSSAPRDVDKIPGLTFSESAIKGEKDLNFLPIDLKKTWREGAVGRERTDAARDKSWYLRNLMERAAAGSSGDMTVGAAQLLGELQFCFLMVLTLANWSCLQQWKRILSLLLSCRQALVEVEDYFVTVVKLLRVQLHHCRDVEGGLFDFGEDGARWLEDLLTQFRANVEDAFQDSDGVKLKAELKKVEEDLRDEYGWESERFMLKRGFLELEDGERVDMDMNGADEEDETGEYAPVVVDLA